jgi:hypothetical protein
MNSWRESNLMTAGQIVHQQMEEIGVVPSLRTLSVDDARFAATTVARAGIPIIEVARAVGDAPEIIAELAADMPELIVGAGPYSMSRWHDCAFRPERASSAVRR